MGHQSAVGDGQHGGIGYLILRLRGHVLLVTVFESGRERKRLARAWQQGVGILADLQVGHGEIVLGVRGIVRIEVGILAEVLLGREPVHVHVAALLLGSVVEEHVTVAREDREVECHRHRFTYMQVIDVVRAVAEGRLVGAEISDGPQVDLVVHGGHLNRGGIVLVLVAHDGLCQLPHFALLGDGQIAVRILEDGDTCHVTILHARDVQANGSHGRSSVLVVKDALGQGVACLLGRSGHSRGVEAQVSGIVEE